LGHIVGHLGVEARERDPDRLRLRFIVVLVVRRPRAGVLPIVNDELNATDGVSSRHAPDARRSLDRKRELLVAHLGQKLVSVVGRLSNAFCPDEARTPTAAVILAIHPLFEDIGEYPPRVADGPTLTLRGAAP